jgi:SPP1 family phage portal protein
MTIEEILSLKDADAMITELQNGRHRTLPDVDDCLNKLDPYEHNIMKTRYRPDKQVFYDSKDNVQDMTEMQEGDDGRKYRIEKVNRVAVALQKLIIGRAVSFTFGNKVNLNADTEGAEADVLKAVNKVLYSVKGRTLNRKIARAIFSFTEAAECWYTVDKPTKLYGFDSATKLRCTIFSPQFGDQLFPYYDETGDMIAFSRLFSIKNRDALTKAITENKFFETWTDDNHYMWALNKDDGTQMVKGYPIKNTIGKIPVIYGCQPHVEYHDVEILIDRLEILLSNFADTDDYHGSPKIFTKGIIDGWSRKGEAGAVIQGEEGSDAKYLSWAEAPESVKLEIETLLKLIYALSQTPDISFDAVKGIGNVSGVALELLFMDAHLKVQDKAEIFDEYLQRRLSVIQAFLSKMNIKSPAFSAACETLTIEPEIIPYTLTDETTKVNNLKAAAGDNAIASQKTAIQKLGWVEDTDKELEQIRMEGDSIQLANATAQEATV